MLSLFPDLLFLSPLAAFLIRVSVGILLIYAAYEYRTDSSIAIRVLAGVQTIAGVLLLVGAYTQAVALFTFVLAVISLVTRNRRIYSLSTLALAAVMAATLLITGPGPFAFDLPL
jgi:hypothetical protein